MGGEHDEEMPDVSEPGTQVATNEGSNRTGSTAADDKPRHTQLTASEPSDANGSTTDAQPADGQLPSEEGGSLRNKSSRVASLRAAFEQPDKTPEPLKRRLTNGSGNEQDNEIARLKSELEKEREMRVSHEARITTLELEVAELNSQLEGQDEEWRAEYARRRQQERSEAQERLNAATEEARSQRHEASTLQKQLSDLKKSVSASTRPSTHVSDVTFREEVGVLQHEMQNWIVQNFRRVKIEASPEELCTRLKTVTEQSQFERLEPIYKTFDSSAKLPTLQATVTCLLMEIFDEPFLFGLHGRVEWAERSRQAAEALLSVLQPAAYSRCRAVTFDALRQSENIKAIVESSAQEVAAKITAALGAVTGLEENEARLTSLTSIMRRVIDLAHLIRVQQAKYKILLPSPGDRYDETCMEDVLEEDREDGVEHTIKFATFPAIFKTTDEEGRQTESQSVIAQAKVLCHDTDS